MIWTRAEPAVRRPRFSREQIAAAALRIADAEGFEAVTMRRLAADLEAGTMTLYNYVRTKDDLVALMHDAIMGEVLIPPGEMPAGWRPALAEIARHTRAALVRHPWSLASLQEAQFGPNAMRHFEQYLAAVAGTGLDAAAKFDLLAIVNAYVFGHATLTAESRTRAARARADPAEVAAMMEYGRAQLETGQFPHIAAMLGDPDAAAGGSAGPPMDEQGQDDQFERGLQAVLDGVTLRTALPGQPPPA